VGGKWRGLGLWVEGVGVEGLGWEMDGRMGGCVGNKKERTILLINIFLYFIPSQVSNPPKTP